MSDPIITEENGRNPDGTFKEGNAGGPGRPKRKSFRDYFTDAEEDEVIERVKQALSEKEIMKMVVEQLFGKPRQNIGLDGGEEDKPISIMSYERAKKIIGGGEGGNTGNSPE